MENKIFIVNNSKQSIGGGWSFMDNFKKGIKENGQLEIVDNQKEADIYFIAGATVADKVEVLNAKKEGKKIILRVDNIPRNSRNRNTGISRLKLFSELADKVIFQSWWAYHFINSTFLKVPKDKTAIIYNSCDLSIFRPDGIKQRKNSEQQYLFIRFNRDETKNWEMAWWHFQQRYFNSNKSHLWIVGAFSEELRQYDFDLFGGAEINYKYWGVISDREFLASIYRSADKFIYSYYNDCCSNCLIEALCSGLKIEMLNPTGGASEIISEYNNKGRDFFALKRMTDQYESVIL